jgi:hypothetical protein
MPTLSKPLVFKAESLSQKSCFLLDVTGYGSRSQFS